MVEALPEKHIIYARDLYSTVPEQIVAHGLDEKRGVDRAVLLETLRCIRGRDVDAMMFCVDRWSEAEGPRQLLL